VTNYNWYISSGLLPPGLSLRSNEYGYGILGTPTQAGTYSFAINVSYGSQSGSKQFTLTVDPGPTIFVYQ
jgi:hypothetical protein